MIETLYTGYWQLKGGTQRVPGRLSVDEEGKKILLQLFGNCLLDGTSVNHGRDIPSVFYHDIVLGYALEPITLYRCSYKGVESLGTDLYQIDYEVGFVIHGATISTMEELVVSSSEFAFPQLASFISLDSVNGHKSLFVPEYDPKNRSAIVDITDNLKIQFIDRNNEDIQSPIDENEYRTVRFLYEQPVDFSNLLDDAIYFKQLMEFSFGKPVCRQNKLNFSLETVS